MPAPSREAELERRDLLAYLSSHTLDEDYAFASERRALRGAEPAPATRRRVGLLGGVVMALFALLVVTAGVQTSRNAVADASQREQLAGQVDAARSRLDGRRTLVDALEADTARLRAQRLAEDSSTSGLQATVERLGVRAGTVPVRGEGVRVLVDDAPDADDDREIVLDSDLQRLTNGLWAAGAEAISINGERLTNRSAIRVAGTAITVNNRSLRRPYTVLALGDRDTLPARFAETSSGQAWLDLAREVGLRLTITPESDLELPAVDPVSLRFANQPAEDSE